MLAITLKAVHCLAFEFDKQNIVLRAILLCAQIKAQHNCIIVCESVLWMPTMSWSGPRGGLMPTLEPNISTNSMLHTAEILRSFKNLREYFLFSNIVRGIKASNIRPFKC